MRTRSRILRWLGLGLVIALALVFVLGTWVVPAVIVAEIRQHHTGYVTITGWWIHWSSAGVTGLTLHETDSPGSPVWATAERVTTDLSLRSLLRGRFAPRRLIFDHPSVSYRLDATGQPLTTIPLQHAGGGPIPELIVRDGQLAMRQADRPEMLISHLKARMVSEPDGPRFEAQADDPRWGNPQIAGQFSADFSSVALRLAAERLVADPDTWARIPFVDRSVWKHFQPHGPLGVVVDFAQKLDPPGPSEV
ncbi:MAG TPA: hypothetical protein VFF52_07095, partial [Isosphaeraceae bacterium]|nr:hypothetical protein [Isosphaeraceae bacterium]